MDSAGPQCVQYSACCPVQGAALGCEPRHVLATWLDMLGFPSHGAWDPVKEAPRNSGWGRHQGRGLGPKSAGTLETGRKVLWARVDLLLLFCFF